MRLAFDGLLSFSYLPLRLTLLAGGIVLAAAFADVLRILYLWLFCHHHVSGIAGLSALVLFLGGIILIALGLFGEYIGRLYDEVKGRPNYVVRHVIEIKGSKD